MGKKKTLFNGRVIRPYFKTVAKIYTSKKNPGILNETARILSKKINIISQP
jgi:hypothetical protein